MAILIKFSQLIFLLFLFLHFKKWMTNKKIILFFIFIILGWVAKNILLTGCLVYPFVHSCQLFQEPWAVSLQSVLIEASYIRVAAFSALGLDVLSVPRALLYHLMTKKVMFLLVIGLCGFLFRMGRDGWNDIKENFHIRFIFLSAFIFWISQAPELRFGFFIFFMLGAF